MVEFSTGGYASTSIATIAARANTSTGNVYKYFANKEDLFFSTIPAELVRELRRLLRLRITALGVERDTNKLSPNHAYRDATNQMLSFSMEHRPQILFLLERSEDSPHAGFVRTLVDDLTRLALAYARRAYPGTRVTPALRRSLRRIYAAFLSHIASLLAEEPRPAQMTQALEWLSLYHLTGLQSLFGKRKP